MTEGVAMRWRGDGKLRDEKHDNNEKKKKSSLRRDQRGVSIPKGGGERDMFQSLETREKGREA